MYIKNETVLSGEAFKGHVGKNEIFRIKKSGVDTIVDNESKSCEKTIIKSSWNDSFNESLEMK